MFACPSRLISLAHRVCYTLFALISRLASLVPPGGLASILVNQGEKSVNLSLELTDAFHNDSQKATFDHSKR
jgi:hypothetical protein